MKKEEFEEIALMRIEEAKILLQNKQYSGAYYLAGYALECAIKACLSKQIAKHYIPEKRFIMEVYTHDLQKLIKLDGDLSSAHAERIKNDNNFEINWTIVKDWSERSRYKKYDKNQAQQLLEAITTTEGGILTWVQQYW